MTSTILYIFVSAIIVWAITQPWKKSWLQFNIFCLVSLVIPAYVIFSENVALLQKAISFSAVTVLVFGIFLNIRYSDINFFGGVLKLKNEVSLETEENKKFQRYSKYLYLIFILFCGIYIFFYGV